MHHVVTGRFAPSPSGRLHLGNILCCLLAYLSARKQGGGFLLRIEDIDLPRCPRHLGEQCIADLQALGFSWDEEPLWQSERSEIYAEALKKLEKQGLVYPCFCTRAELHAAQAPNRGDTQVVYPGTCANLTTEEVAERFATREAAWRLRVPAEEISFTDGLYGRVTEQLARDCGDFILRRRDGLWGYQLAVVVDDALTGVTEVVRGEDILSATPRQIYLQRLLGFPSCRYVHIPLLTDSQGRRLAKRDKDLDLSALLMRYTPEDILGALAFAAGLLPDNRPASLPELVKVFDWNKVPRHDLRLPADFGT